MEYFQTWGKNSRENFRPGIIRRRHHRLRIFFRDAEKKAH
jgi:hypothetical protein